MTAAQKQILLVLIIGAASGVVATSISSIAMHCGAYFVGGFSLALWFVLLIISIRDWHQ